MRSWLGRAAPRPFVGLVFGVLTFEALYVLLPLALGSQGVSYSSVPSWLSPFLSWGLPLIAAASIAYSLGIPSRRAMASARRAKEDRELALRMEVDQLKEELRKVKAGDVSDPGKARETGLVPEPTSAQKRDWYSEGRKVWEKI
ncbi:MAG: hypothetical protein JRN17_05540 [Nitrososphaerota archaeon]|nr:hypothetical protein [Nitrososphaerota archaeon]MDG6969817.1 hypothetical protein [Nitrososphaerota archaeon]MDG7012534.1 hypothetical protein [Nitrososphaerota archaeon]